MSRHNPTAPRPGSQDPRSSGSRTRGLALLSALIATVQAASAIPTALYDRYAQQWHLTPTDITVAFGGYALVLLASLLVFGRLSDYIGRKPVMLATIAVQIIANAVLLGANGFGLLMTGRILQGLASGAGFGAMSAAMLEVDRKRGGVANAAAPLTGSALGALLAAIAIQLLPAPEQLSYIVALAVFIFEAVLVLRLPETANRHDGALASLRPRIALPPAAVGAFIAAAPVVFAVYALAGLFGSLGPSLTAGLTGTSSIIVTVLPFVALSAASPIMSIAIRNRPPKQALGLGIAGLVVGVVLTGAAVPTKSLALLLIGAALSGVGFGAGFRGGLQLVTSRVASSEYGGTISLVYIAAYLGFGVPAIIAGIVQTATNNAAGTTLGYCVVLLVLAALAGIALARVRPAPAPDPAA